MAQISSNSARAYIHSWLLRFTSSFTDTIWNGRGYATGSAERSPSPYSLSPSRCWCPVGDQKELLELFQALQQWPKQLLLLPLVVADSQAGEPNTSRALQLHENLQLLTSLADTSDRNLGAIGLPHGKLIRIHLEVNLFSKPLVFSLSIPLVILPSIPLVILLSKGMVIQFTIHTTIFWATRKNR